MIELSGAILAESALSFLGIGVQPPTPSWGTMIKDSREQLESNPMLILWPCLALSLTILSLNIIGDYLRDRFDPKRAST
jgi:peptide/nickel transport system permease protein